MKLENIVGFKARLNLYFKVYVHEVKERALFLHTLYDFIMFSRLYMTWITSPNLQEYFLIVSYGICFEYFVVVMYKFCFSIELN